MVQKNLWSKSLKSEKMLSKNLGKKIEVPKIISPKKCCVRKLSPAKNWVPKTLVKIGSVIADILFLWRNVTLKVASVKDCPRNLPLKFGQNQVSDS